MHSSVRKNVFARFYEVPGFSLETIWKIKILGQIKH